MKTSEVKVANAPCSWGVLEFDIGGEAPGYVQVLDELSATGYQGTELGDWGFMPTDPARLHQEIAGRNLALLGAFVPVALSDRSRWPAGIEQALKTAQLMADAGYPDAFIVLADDNGTVKERTSKAGRITEEDSLDERRMEVFCRGAESVARSVRDEYGLRTVFHHHCAGYVETPFELERFLAHTDPGLVGLCFDTGHFMFGGGGDPLEVLSTHWDRVWHIHFKDFSSLVAQKSIAQRWDYFESIRQGVFCELGKGAVDFKSIKHFLDQKGYKGWIVVEQDVLPGMGSPRACALDNRNYLKSIGL